jgi:hypothetical protein
MTIAQRIISEKSNKPSLKDLREAVKRKGLDVELRNFSLGNFHASYGDQLHAAAQDKMDRTFDQLVALVGLARTGALDLSANINAAVSELAPNLLIDGGKPFGDVIDDLAQNVFDVPNRNTCADAARDDIVNRIKSAYDELCGPAAGTSKSPSV